MILLHVEPAHVLGEPGGGGLHVHKLLSRLRAVAERQLRLDVVVGCLLDALDQLRNRDFAEHVASPLCVAHVALDEAAVGPADFGQRFAGRKVDNLVDVQALVRFAPP